MSISRALNVLALLPLWTGGPVPLEPFGSQATSSPQAPVAERWPGAAPELLPGLDQLDSGDRVGALKLWDRLLAPQSIGLKAFHQAQIRPGVLSGLDRVADLGRVSIALGLPEEPKDEEEALVALEAGLARLGGMGPGARRIAGSGLLEWSRVQFEDDTLERRLAGLLQRPRASVRLAAAELGARLGALAEREAPEEALSDPIALGRQLVLRAVLDRDPLVRRAAAHSLGDLGETAWIEPLERALAARDWTLRQNAADALALTGLEAAEGPLWMALARPAGGATGDPDFGGPTAYFFAGRQIAYVSDFDVEVATGQSIADPVVNVLTEGQSLWVSVRSVESRQDAFRRSVIAALSQLTGREVPRSVTPEYALEALEQWKQRAKAPTTGAEAK